MNHRPFEGLRKQLANTCIHHNAQVSVNLRKFQNNYCRSTITIGMTKSENQIVQYSEPAHIPNTPHLLCFKINTLIVSGQGTNA